jgi:hypothetical protein
MFTLLEIMYVRRCVSPTSSDLVGRGRTRSDIVGRRRTIHVCRRGSLISLYLGRKKGTRDIHNTHILITVITDADVTEEATHLHIIPMSEAATSRRMARSTTVPLYKIVREIVQYEERLGCGNCLHKYELRPVTFGETLHTLRRRASHFEETIFTL